MGLGYRSSICQNGQPYKVVFCPSFGCSMPHLITSLSPYMGPSMDGAAFEILLVAQLENAAIHSPCCCAVCHEPVYHSNPSVTAAASLLCYAQSHTRLEVTPLDFMGVHHRTCHCSPSARHQIQQQPCLPTKHQRKGCVAHWYCRRNRHVEGGLPIQMVSSLLS